MFKKSLVLNCLITRGVDLESKEAITRWNIHNQNCQNKAQWHILDVSFLRDRNTERERGHDGKVHTQIKLGRFPREKETLTILKATIFEVVSKKLTVRTPYSIPYIDRL